MGFKRNDNKTRSFVGIVGGFVNSYNWSFDTSRIKNGIEI